MARLRAEESAARRAAEELEHKLDVISNYTVEKTATVAERIRDFLGQHFTMSFSAGEVADAIHAANETTRKTLHRMTERGEIVHVGYGMYELNGHDRQQRMRNMGDV